MQKRNMIPFRLQPYSNHHLVPTCMMHPIWMERLKEEIMTTGKLSSIIINIRLFLYFVGLMSARDSTMFHVSRMKFFLFQWLVFQLWRATVLLRWSNWYSTSIVGSNCSRCILLADVDYNDGWGKKKTKARGIQQWDAHNKASTKW